MIVFSLFFGRMAAGPSAGLPYPLFVLAGLVPWIFFSNAISSAAQSIVGNQNLVTKIYFPRLIIPMGAIGAGLVDFALSFAMLMAMLLCAGVRPGWGILLIPLIVLGLMIAALGVGILLSALTVAYRDFRYVVPFMIQLWMFATPSIYLQNESAIGPRGRLLLPFNPVHGWIDSFRRVLAGGSPDPYLLIVSVVISLVLFQLGWAYFRHVERYFADII